MNAYAHRLGHLAPEQLQAALDRFELGRLISTSPVTTGNFGQNLRVVSTTGTYILRGNPFFDWQFAKERLIAGIIHERTVVPGPWPFLHEPSPELFGWEYAIMPLLPGLNLGDATVYGRLSKTDRLNIATALGTTASALQHARFDGPRAFDLAANALVSLPGKAIDRIEQRIRDNLGKARTETGYTTDADVAWVEDTLAAGRRHIRDDGPWCLLHGDLTTNNIVATTDANKWQISGIFDLMTASVGDGESDLCRQFAVYVDQEPASASAFMAGYFDYAPMRPGFRERFPIYLLDERLTLWEWLQRTSPDWWQSSTIGLRDWIQPVLDALPHME